jgi:hypothetical protein
VKATFFVISPSPPIYFLFHSIHPTGLLPGYSVKASFFAASRSTAAWLANRYKAVTTRALAAGYLLTEEYYLAMVVREEPHRCKWHARHAYYA